MRISSVLLKPYPGYEAHVGMTLQTDESQKYDREELKKILRTYQLGEGMTMEDIQIPGTEEGQTLRLRVVKPAGAAQGTPVIMDGTAAALPAAASTSTTTAVRPWLS